ncbi:4684_t:CDS:2, partial [Gigaspora margarita]
QYSQEFDMEESQTFYSYPITHDQKHETITKLGGLCADYDTLGVDIDKNTPADEHLDFLDCDYEDPKFPLYAQELSLVLCNPPFNGYGNKLGSEVWLDKIIEFFGKEVAIVLFVPVGFRVNLTEKSPRYLKLANGTYPAISKEEIEEREPNTYRIMTITHQVKVGDLSLNTKFYLEKSLNKLEEYLQEKIPQEIRKMIIAQQYITENGATPHLRKGIITIRQSGIRVKAPDYFPCLTHNPVIPIIYDNCQQKYRYLNKTELLSLQNFPPSYQFPNNYSLTKIASLLGNSLNLSCLEYFLKDKLSFGNSIAINLKPKFVDLFAGIGGFHLVLKDYCSLAVDINKSCQETYTLNFPNTPFLLGDINDKKIQKQIIQTEFDLLCAGFPCQPYSRAGKNQGKSEELTSLLKIIQKKQPQYLLLENIPNFLTSSGSSKFLLFLLTNYQLQIATLNPTDLGIKQNRPRLFI